MKSPATVYFCLIISIAASASAQVAPEHVGVYSGKFIARTTATDDSVNDRSKSLVDCTIEPDGSTHIFSQDGMSYTGHLISGQRYGFFSVANEFTTGTGVWKFNKRGAINGRLLYGVQPGGSMAYIVDARIKLKKLEVNNAR